MHHMLIVVLLAVEVAAVWTVGPFHRRRRNGPTCSPETSFRLPFQIGSGVIQDGARRHVEAVI